MPVKKLERDSDDRHNEWVGNNAAFTCPVCNNVFLVSGYLNPRGRKCPSCNKALGRVQGRDKKGRKAHAEIEWSED